MQSDRVIYLIRPKDDKHPVLLPIGETAHFRLHKGKFILQVPETDGKEREYVVVSMTPRQDAASQVADKKLNRRPPSGHKGHLIAAVTSENCRRNEVANHPRSPEDGVNRIWHDSENYPTPPTLFAVLQVTSARIDPCLKQKVEGLEIGFVAIG